MKKVLCCLLMVLLLCSAALADATHISGDVILQDGSYTLNASQNESGFEAVLSGPRQITLRGAWQADGTLLAGDGKLAAHLPAPLKAGAFDDVLAALDTRATYSASRFSSKFTHAQQLELQADELMLYADRLLTALPFIDVDGRIRRAIEQAPAGQVYGTITRFLPDVKQYPNDWLLLIEAAVPGAPALYAELRWDDFGVNFVLVKTDAVVTDWDETIGQIERGGDTQSVLLEGFTMEEADSVIAWTNLEATLYLYGAEYSLELDHYALAAMPTKWDADLQLTQEGAGVVLQAKLSSEAGGGPANIAVDYSTLVDLTDGMTSAEKAQLGL